MKSQRKEYVDWVPIDVECEEKGYHFGFTVYNYFVLHIFSDVGIWETDKEFVVSDILKMYQVFM